MNTRCLALTVVFLSIPVLCMSVENPCSHVWDQSSENFLTYFMQGPTGVMTHGSEHPEVLLQHYGIALSGDSLNLAFHHAQCYIRTAAAEYIRIQGLRDRFPALSKAMKEEKDDYVRAEMAYTLAWFNEDAGIQELHAVCTGSSLARTHAASRIESMNFMQSKSDESCYDGMYSILVGKSYNDADLMNAIQLISSFKTRLAREEEFTAVRRALLKYMEPGNKLNIRETAIEAYQIIMRRDIVRRTHLILNDTKDPSEPSHLQYIIKKNE